MLLSLATAALAQSTFTIYEPTMLEAAPGSWYAWGMGSPTVVYRKKHDDYVMFFESRVAPPDATCNVGYWGVGVATSTDGRNWTVADSPVLPPEAGTYRSCVVAHPYAVVADDGDEVHLWFKAEQPRFACGGAPGSLPWGCNQYTGVGYVRLGEDLTTIVQDSALPVVDVDYFGYPAVTRVDGTWYMLLAKVPDLYLATSDQPDGNWVLDPTPVMEPGVAIWANDELFNPAVVCDEESTLFPFKVYFGGRNRTGWTITDGGWGDAISSDATSWLVNVVPHFTFQPNPGDLWRHWDAVKVGSTDTLIYFSERTGGKNAIGFAGTTDVWSDDDVETRVCPELDWWYQLPSGGDLGSRTQTLRTLLDDFATAPGTSTCAADRIDDDAQPWVDDAFGEIMKGHPHHYAESLRKVIEELESLTADCGDDTTELQQQVAALAIYSIESLLERTTSVAGPSDAEVLDTSAHLADAIAAYGAGDYWQAAEDSRLGGEDGKDPDWSGDFCPATGASEPYHAALCQLQTAEALADALFLTSGDGDVEDARDKLREAAEGAAVTDIEHVAQRVREAIEKFQNSPVDTTSEQEAAAEGASMAVRQMIDDAILSGHPSQQEIDDAELAWADGEALLASGDTLGATMAFEDAAAEIKW